MDKFQKHNSFNFPLYFVKYILHEIFESKKRQLTKLRALDFCTEFLLWGEVLRNLINLNLSFT
jgi:hypothetical protein